MCCCSPHIVVQHTDNGLLTYRANCKQWPCPDCSPYLTRKLRSGLLDGAPTKFMTLTCVAVPDETQTERRKRMGKGLLLLMRKIKRRYGLKRLPYAVIVEAHKSGEPHFHVLLRAPFIDQDWVGQQWQALGFGRVAKVDAVWNRYGASRYLTKYLSKAPAKFGTTKRFWYSRDWKLTPKDKAKAHQQTATVRLLKGFTIAGYRALLIEAGYELISCTKDRIEARHPGAARAPPLWECTVDISELALPRRRRKPDTETTSNVFASR
jgi:hypothetical protein